MAVIKSEYLLPNYDPEEVGMKGEKGDDGKTSYVHIAYSNSSDGGVDFSTTDPTNRAYTGYYTDFEMIDSTDPSNYEWQRTKGDSGKDGVAGKDGLGLQSTTISYAKHTNASTPPSTGWQTQVPTVPAGQYLWTKTVWTYTDNSSETGYSVARMGQDGAKGNDGVAGKDGVGIKTTIIEYVVSTSGTVRPTSGWSTTIPSVPAGQYLWTRTTWTYTDNTTEQGYSVARMGQDGAKGNDGVAGKDGVGLKSTSISYAGSTSGTTPPSTGWNTQVPSVPAGQYLWTKTVWTYTDNSSETGYSVAIMGQDGAKGNDGIAGKDGVGIKTTRIEYAVNTSGTVRPTSGWSTTIPNTPQGQYLWTRTTWTYTDNTTEQGYSVARQGNNGQNGANGSDGADGVGISTTIIEYNKSTSSATPPATGWTSTIPTISGGEFLWTRVTLNYTNGTKAESYTVARQGEDGSDGQLFTGETEPTKFNEGDIWYKVISGKVVNVYEAKGGTWVEIPFESSVIAETIIGKTIQASHLTGSTIDGGKISGAEFLNEYTNVTSGVNQVTDGKLGIKDGILQAGSTYYLTNSAGERLYKFATTEADIHQGTVNLRQRLYDETGTQTSESTTAVSGGLITLSITDDSGNYHGVLDAKALTRTPWVNLQMGSLWEAAENNPPQYRIIYNLDGSRTIKFKGQVKLKSGTMSPGNTYLPFSQSNSDGPHYLPENIRPQSRAFAYAPVGVSSGTTYGGQWAVTPSGWFSLGVAQSNTTYAVLTSLSYDLV